MPSFGRDRYDLAVFGASYSADDALAGLALKDVRLLRVGLNAQLPKALFRVDFACEVGGQPLRIGEMYLFASAPTKLELLGACGHDETASGQNENQGNPPDSIFLIFDGHSFLHQR
jgi:hypothetical protein